MKYGVIKLMSKTKEITLIHGNGMTNSIVIFALILNLFDFLPNRVSFTSSNTAYYSYTECFHRRIQEFRLTQEFRQPPCTRVQRVSLGNKGCHGNSLVSASPSVQFSRVYQHGMYLEGYLIC